MYSPRPSQGRGVGVRVLMPWQQDRRGICPKSPGRTKGSGALERIRTSDPQLRKLVLYPLSYERKGSFYTRLPAESPRPDRLPSKPEQTKQAAQFAEPVQYNGSMRAVHKFVLLVTALLLTVVGVVACNDSQTTLQNPVVTVDQAKRSREIYEKAQGSWDAMSEADKAEMIKMHSDEAKAKAIWGAMSTPRAEGTQPNVPPAAPNAPTAPGAGRNDLPSGMPPEATTGG